MFSTIVFKEGESTQNPVELNITTNKLNPFVYDWFYPTLQFYSALPGTSKGLQMNEF